MIDVSLAVQRRLLQKHESDDVDEALGGLEPDGLDVDDPSVQHVVVGDPDGEWRAEPVNLVCEGRYRGCELAAIGENAADWLDCKAADAGCSEASEWVSHDDIERLQRAMDECFEQIRIFDLADYDVIVKSDGTHEIAERKKAM